MDGPWKKQLESAIEGGRNVNFVNEATGKTILHDACAECSLEVVAFLLRSGADPSIVTRQNRSTLYYAALNKDPRVSERILAFSDDPDARLVARDNQQMTPFDMACLNANGATAQWLYSQYPKKELEKSRTLDPTHRTALHLLLTGSTVSDQQLLDLNAFIKVIMKARPSYIWRRDAEGRTPLAVHIENHFRDAILQTFHVVLANLSSAQDVDTALHMVVNRKAKRKAPYEPEKWLVLQRLCIQPRYSKFLPAIIPFISDRTIFAQDPSGRSILHWFALYGHTTSFVENMVDLWRDYDKPLKNWAHPLGFDVPHPTTYGNKGSFYSELCWSSLLHRESVLSAAKSLAGKTTEAHSPESHLRIFDNNKDTPLHIAAKYNNFKAVEKLEFLFPGEGKSWKDGNGRSALHVAALNDSAATIPYLVKVAHCDVEERDNEGYTPLMLALREKKDAAVSVLNQLKATCQDLSSSDGSTSIEQLKEEYDRHVEEQKALKEERRKARLAAQEEEEEEDVDTEDELEVKDDKAGNDTNHNDNDNGSDSGGSVNSMEEHDSGDEITSPISNGIFRPKIKLDSEYDEEMKESPKPIILTPSTQAPVRPANGRPMLTRKPRVQITPTDDYSHSSDEDETSSTESMEIHSDSAESPPASPRSSDSNASPRSPEPSPKKTGSSSSSSNSSPEISAMDDRQKAELERRVRELEELLAAAERTHQEQIKEKEKNVIELRSLVKEQEDALNFSREELESSKLRHSSNGDELARSKEDNTRIQVEVDRLSNELSTSQKERENLKQDLEKIQTENMEMKEQLERLKSELESSKAENENLELSQSKLVESKVSQLNGELTQQSSQLDALKQEKAHLEQSLSSSTAEIKRLESSSKQQSDTIELLQQELDQTKSALSSSQSAVYAQEAQSSIDALGSDADHLIKSSRHARSQALQLVSKEASSSYGIVTAGIWILILLGALFALMNLFPAPSSRPLNYHFS